MNQSEIQSYRDRIEAENGRLQSRETAATLQLQVCKDERLRNEGKLALLISIEAALPVAAVPMEVPDIGTPPVEAPAPSKYDVAKKKY